MAKVFCLNCDEEKEYYTKDIEMSFTVKGVEVKTTVKQAYCCECNKGVFVYQIERENQRKIFDAYKKSFGLLTSEEIISIRKKYNLSQRQLAKLIKCGEKNIARYENGAIQDQPINLLIKMLDEHPEYFGLVDYNKPLYIFSIDLDTTYQENESLLYKEWGVTKKNRSFKGDCCNA